MLRRSILSCQSRWPTSASGSDDQTRLWDASTRAVLSKLCKVMPIVWPIVLMAQLVSGSVDHNCETVGCQYRSATKLCIMPIGLTVAQS